MVADGDVEDGSRADKDQREKQTCGNMSHSFFPCLIHSQTAYG
jgi:hypothetical protein